MVDIDLPDFKLFQRDVYLFYDGPKFFKAINEHDLSYLVLLIEEDADGEIYLIVRLDDEKIEQMTSGEVGVLETIREGSEFYASDLKTTWEKISFEILQEHQLPEPNVFFPNKERMEELNKVAEDQKWNLRHRR